MVRRGIALGAGILILIFLVLGIKGCLGARKDRTFRNYADDVRALIKSSQDTSTRFFDLLAKPKGADALEVQNQVNAVRADAEQLVKRAESTDRPDELSSANDWILQAFEFRAAALARIAEKLPTALGDKEQKPAISAIAGQMQALLASDVIYSQRAYPDLQRQYKKRRVDETFPNPSDPANHFLPDLGWLDPKTVESRLAKISGAQAGPATPGAHGTGLQDVTAQPSGTTLSSDQVNRVPTGNQLSLDIQVQNQGESEETDIDVTVTIQDGTDISIQQTIPRIAAGEPATASIPLTQAPPLGKVTKVTVDVASVPGEQTRDNNKQTYQVVFTKG